MKKLTGATTRLEKRVQAIANRHSSDYGIREWLEDLLQHGC